MGLWQSINKILNRNKKPQYTSPPVSNTIGSLGMPWTMSDDRKSIWQDLTDMDEKYVIVSRGLDILANFAVFAPDAIQPNVVFRGDKKALDVIEPMLKRININDQLFELARSSVQYGDHFCELVIDDKYDIIALKQIPRSYTIVVNEDGYGRLKNGDPQASIPNGGVAAYDQYDDDLVKVIAAFWQNQIIHFRCGYPSRKSPYTNPILLPILSVWKRHMAKLDSIAIQRLTKSFDIFVHKIPVPLQATPSEKNKIIQDYINNVTKDFITTYDTSSTSFKFSKREKPTTVPDEFYVQRNYTPDGKIVDGEIENIDTSPSAIREIGDIELDIKLIMTSLMVPQHYYPMQIGERTFVDKSSDKAEESFSYMVKSIQDCIIKGIREICDYQLLLDGIDPDDVHYEITLSPVRPSSTNEAADTDNIRANTATALLDIGVPESIIGPKILGFTPEETAEWIAKSEIQQKKPTKDSSESETTPPTDNPGGDTKSKRGRPRGSQKKSPTE